MEKKVIGLVVGKETDKSSDLMIDPTAENIVADMQKHGHRMQDALPNKRWANHHRPYCKIEAQLWLSQQEK